MFIVKFGGSIITDKSKKNCFKKEIVDRLASELEHANKKIILIHGAGSFGHILAKKYELNSGYRKKKQIEGFSLTQAMVQHLNNLVLDSLHNHNLPAVSIPPHAFLTLSNHKLSRINYSIFKKYLDLEFMPVSFGDVTLDKKLGFSICSGDLLVQLLAKKFKPEKVIFLFDEDGLYSSNPKNDKNAVFIEHTTINGLDELKTQLNSHADVTKGMSGKLHTIKQIARIGIDTILLNGNVHNRLYDTLRGKKVKQTIIHGEKL